MTLAETDSVSQSDVEEVSPPPTSALTIQKKRKVTDDKKLKAHYKLFLDPYAIKSYEKRKETRALGHGRESKEAQKIEDTAYNDFIARFGEELALENAEYKNVSTTFISRQIESNLVFKAHTNLLEELQT